MGRYLAGTVAVIFVGASLTWLALLVQACRDFDPGVFHED